MTVLDLCCCMGFSLIAESRAILYCGMQASHGGGFFSLQSMGSGGEGFSNCGAWPQSLQFPGSRAQAQWA